MKYIRKIKKNSENGETVSVMLPNTNLEDLLLLDFHEMMIQHLFYLKNFNIIFFHRKNYFWLFVTGLLPCSAQN